MTAVQSNVRTTRVDDLLGRRTALGRPFFSAESERIARLCHRMAERFLRGGRLIALGSSPAAWSDVRHIAVEFVHPVIVGKRALPAIGLTPGSGTLAAQVDLLTEPLDIVIGFGDADPTGEPETRGARDLTTAIEAARVRGCLTIAFAELGAEWTFGVPSDDAFVRQELVETLYHILWELVHVFFEHRGLLGGQSPAVPDVPSPREVGAASFLYPFLADEERDLDALIADVRQSVIMKANETALLRIRTIGEDGDSDAWTALLVAADALRAAFDAGGCLFAFGNGGSATDAMDAVADYRYPPRGWSPRRAIDLSEDPAILTALANDIGPDAIFARQLIAYARAGDVAMAFSTSGSSRNVIDALGEARRRGLRSIAFVGYDGGRILAEGLADHVIVSPSEYVPRIQEAQAAAHHILRELVEENQ